MWKEVDDPYGRIDRGVLQAIGLSIVKFSQAEEALAFGVSCLVAGTVADDAADLLARKLPFKGLLETFGGLYRHRFPSDDFNELDSICSDLESLNNERNHLVHSFWTPGDAADKLGRFRRAIRSKGAKTWDENVNEADVLKFAKRADEAYSRLLGFVVEHVLQRINDVVPKR